MTTQATILQPNLVTYSEPLTGYDIGLLCANVIEDCGLLKDPDKFRHNFALRIAALPDSEIIKSFNKNYTLRIRSFAPGLFQVVYDGFLKYN